MGSAQGQILWLGLDYGPVFKWLEKHPQQEEDDFWEALKVIEAAAIRERNKHAD